MTITKASVLMAVATLTGCSALISKPDFVPADPETMTEWEVEGAVRVSGEQGRKKAYITYRNINGEYRLEVRQDHPVGAPQAVVKGKEGEDATSEVVDVKNPEAGELAKTLQASLPLNKMSYWLRGLPATENAQVSKDGDAPTPDEIQDDGWNIQYDSYMQVNRFLLPESMEMEKGDTDVKIDLVRAETGYLTNPCSVASDYDKNAATEEVTGNPLDQLVPRDGSAPLPRWINEAEFCAQVYKVHGRIPDPRVGLYGPGSMMWKLNAPMAPGGMGAGRALLLQTSHPWITAGIDEHSIVRYDPMERFRRTFGAIYTLVYGSMPQVMAAANKAHLSHKEIQGKIPYEAGAFHKDSEYRANEIAAMIWVHATLWETITKMYEELQGPLSAEEKDRFYEETKLFAMLFGIPESALPRNWNEFMAYNEAMWRSPQLTVTDNARKLKDDLFTARSVFLIFPLWIQKQVTAVNLPPRIREGYGFDYGLWERFNNAWLMTSAGITSRFMPDYFVVNPIHHEAEARLEGKRLDYFHRKQIETVMGSDRMVN